MSQGYCLDNRWFLGDPTVLAQTLNLGQQVSEELRSLEELASKQPGAPLAPSKGSESQSKLDIGADVSTPETQTWG